MADPVFISLPVSLQRRIDTAFDKATQGNGGFVVDNISLSTIPDALQLLDLQPDDKEVLAVFRNAASGWGAKNDQEGLVSRKDWRAVCAVLLEGRGEEEDLEEPPDAQYSGAEESEADHESDAYNEQSGTDSDDDYMEDGSLAARSPSKRRTRKGQLPSDEEDGPRTLTARQKHECRRAFSMFFPDVSGEQLDKQKLMIKDITRVAQLLNEKLKAEDVRVSTIILNRHTQMPTPRRL